MIKWGLAAAAGAVVLACAIAGSAMAATGASALHDTSMAPVTPEDIAFTFTISGLPAGKSISVNYSSNETGLGGSVQAKSGSMTQAWVTQSFLFVVASTAGPFTGPATETFSIGSAPFTGTSDIPAGTAVTLTNGKTGQTITLATGSDQSFSLPSGVGPSPSPSSTGLGAAPPPPSTTASPPPTGVSATSPPPGVGVTG